MNQSEFTTDILHNMSKSQGISNLYTLDPATFLLILEIVREVLKCVNSFNDIKNPGLIKRAQFWLMVRSKCSDKTLKISREIRSAFYEEAEKLTEQQFNEIKTNA